MIFLQVWIGDEIDDFRKSLIVNNLRFLGSKDKLVFIASKNYLKGYDNVEYINVNKYIQSISDKFVKKIARKIPKDRKFRYAVSDIIRLHYASKNKKVLYLDTDVELKKEMILQNNVYFHKNEIRVDYFIFYNSDNIDYFDKLLLNSLNDLSSNFEFRLRNRKWVLRNIDVDNIKTFDKSVYKHYALRGL